MRRAVAVGAAALAMLTTTGCQEELHRWGARMRGAPVVDYGEPGGPTWYTGHAERSDDLCWSEGRELGVSVGALQVVCDVFYPWVEGSLGYADVP